MNKMWIAFTAVFALLVPTLSAAQDEGLTLTYQGTLTDSGGQSITGTRQVRFSLYTSSDGGAPVWTENHPQVDVVDGAFTSVLGRAVRFEANLAEHSELYLGVRIEGDVEMTPRLRVGGALEL